MADVVGNLINGHYRHQQHMAELENEYRLEKTRIEQETVINCKKIDATLSYALKHLEMQMEQSRQNFALLVKNLDLQLEDNKKIEQHITDLMKVATNPAEMPDVRLMVLKETLPALLKSQQQNVKQRHALLAQQLQANGALVNSNASWLLK